MKRFIALLALLPLLAVGAPNDLLISQRNGTDTGTIARTVAIPLGGVNGILAFNGASVLPVTVTLGSNLTMVGGVLNATSAAQVNSDWNAVSGAALILNKPTLFSGAYADLTGKPTLFSGAYADLTGKPALFSGAYADLTGKPTIPAAQVSSDWNSATSPTQILNKPAIPAAQIQTDWNAVAGIGVLLNKPATFPPSAHNQAWSTITATPTTIAGYGLTDAASLTQLATKFNIPTGTTAQYIRGDGSLATLPIAKRIETYTGTTNASGQIIVTYPAAFSQAPNVQTPPPALANQVWTLTASTTSGFTAVLNQRNVVTLLGLEVLLGAVVPVSGSAAQIVVIER